MRTSGTGLAGDEPQALGASDQELAPGQDVGEYRVEQCIGRGGFGTVYRALQPVIGKPVAIKVLARKYSADPEVVSRFVAEARAVNQIRHRNIIDIFAFGQLADGRHYYVMELLEGETLAERLAQRGPMALAEALPILRAIARAIDAAHAKGIAHRDLKPDNIFLATDSDGTVFPKLLDFGIAKLLDPEDDHRHRTGTGVPLGTPYYMSPEQCRGKDVDARTDLYSFGVMAFRVLTGALPFESDNYLELLFQHVHDVPPLASTKRPGLPAAVDNALAWLMAKAPGDRPPSLAAGVAALDPNAASSAVTAPVAPAPTAKRARPPIQLDPLAQTAVAGDTQPPPAARPKSRAWIVALLGAGLLGGGAMVYALGGSSAAPAPAPAPAPLPQPQPVAPHASDAAAAAPAPPDAPVAVDAAAPDAPAPRDAPRHVKTVAPKPPPPRSGSASGSNEPRPPDSHDIINSSEIFPK